MPKYDPLTKEDLRARIKEIEERIKVFDRREKAVTDFKKWMAARKLEITDIMWIVRKLRPKRADKPAKSKLPLHAVSQRSLKAVPKSSTGRFYVSEGRTYKGDIALIKYLSPDGKYVYNQGRKPQWLQDYLKRGGKMEALLLNKASAAAPNGAAASP